MGKIRGLFYGLLLWLLVLEALVFGDDELDNCFLGFQQDNKK